MNISITFRHMESTDAVKTYATEKLGKLQRMLRQPMKVEVKLSTQHLSHTAEVDIHAGSDHFHAHETTEDMYATLDKVADKLERQVRSKNEEKKKKGGERASDHLMADRLDDSGEE